MRPFPPIAAAAALLLVAGSSQAQIVGGFGHRQSVGVHVRTGPYNSLIYVAGAYGFGFGPIYGPVPSWYYGWPGVAFAPNAILVQPSFPPVVVQNIIQAPGVVAPGPERQVFVPPEFDPPAAKPAKPPKPAARAVVPVLPPDPPKPPALVGRAGADRVAEAGRKAFADGQYGRALELFRRAAEIMPNEPSNHYLIAQAEFALGKYREAGTAIATGMAVRPDWPEARFVSRDLYWKKPDLF